MASPQASGRFKEVGEEQDIARLCGMLFGIIKQMQHLCGVANMIVSPSGALSPLGFALGWQSPLGVYNHVGNPTEMLHLFNVRYFQMKKNIWLYRAGLNTSNSPIAPG